MTTKKTPLSIESLLSKKKAEEEARSRPVFLTKAQREAKAKEEADKQALEKDKRKEDDHRRRGELELKASQERASQQQDRYGGRPGPQNGNAYRGGQQQGQGPQHRGGYDGRNRSGVPPSQHQNGSLDYGSKVPTGPKAMRTSGQEDHHDGRNSNGRGQPSSSTFEAPRASTSASANGTGDSQDDYVLPVYDPAALKARYLGDRSGKPRKVRKQSDKKFIFDWDKAEDTATADEVDPFYRALRAGDPSSIAANGRQLIRPNAARPGYNKIEEIKGEGEEEDVPLAGPAAVSSKPKTKTGPIDERHWSEKPLSEMKDRDWRIFKEDFSIAARGGTIPLPLRNWEEAHLPEEIADIISDIGYNEPSAIQRQAIPIGLNVRDMIGIAETGSGKTAAFVIPMLVYISKLPPLTDANRHQGPYALILAPTRELAQQIETETRKFTSRLGYKCVSIVGGRSMEEQALNMRDGAEIIIATPGRLKDCIERNVVVFSQCTYVVMDEADRMIGLGFEVELTTILDSLPVSNMKPDSEEAEDASKMLQTLIGKEGEDLATVYMYRQTMMFSATMPAACERLARKYLRRPAIVTIGVAGQAVDRVEQRVEFIMGDDKRRQRVLEVLRTEGFEPPIICFVNTKKAADVLSRDLNRSSWSSTTMHSGKTQEQREAALASLRSGEVNILVATDLAGRGIDVPDVSLVVNFEMANTIEAYVHRIGRTGRAGKMGVALTFLSNSDADVMYDLKQEISKSPVSKVPQELAKHESAQSKISQAMKRKAYEMETD